MKTEIEKRVLLGVTIGGININAPVSSNFSSVSGILGFVSEVLNWLIGFSAVVAVIMIVYSGFLFMTAAGDPEKISNGQKALTAAVIGLVIVFLAKVIVLFVLDILKV